MLATNVRKPTLEIAMSSGSVKSFIPPAKRSRIGAILAVLLVIGVAGCREQTIPVARRNVLLVVVDTLRTDRVGSYGAKRNTTPNLDALAAEATRFARAYATAPWTQPAVGSILTGRRPRAHRAPGRLHGLANGVDTLAEILQRQGYATAAVISHHLLGKRFGFARGFDTFLDGEAQGPRHISTAGVTKQASAWLRDHNAGEQPFFLLVHYFDPHYRYFRHREVGFAPDSAGRLSGDRELGELRRMLPDMTPEELAFVRDLYDEEVAHTDAGIGKLLGGLRELGSYDETLIVVTADHGEELGERGWLGHTRTLYDELIRVPLLIRIPGQAPSVIDRPVSLAWLATTLLEQIGMNSNEVPFDGPSLFAAVAGEDGSAGTESARPATATPVFASVDFVPVRADEFVNEVQMRAVRYRPQSGRLGEGPHRGPPS